MWNIALSCAFMAVIISIIIYLKAKNKGETKVSEFKGKIAELREDRL
jgi:hypothetical protein